MSSPKLRRGKDITSAGTPIVKSGAARAMKPTPVTLTDEQRQRLERLWFYYGNYGPQTTPGNHQFIQRILEQGIDIRPLITKRSRKSEIPTPECEAAVERVLAMGNATEGDDELSDGSRLQALSSPEDE